MTLGRFITFEGAEGAGKSTQIRLLAQTLEAAGVEVVVTREPGGTPLGTHIRALLLSTGGEIAPLAELLLYSADRAQHVASVIEPALHSGKWVLCDRHADSLVAYQAFGRGLDRAVVDRLNALATGGLRPELTFLLDLDPELGLERAGRRGSRDRLELEGIDFHRRVRMGYLAIASDEPRRICVLAANRPPADLHSEIWKRVVTGQSSLAPLDQS